MFVNKCWLNKCFFNFLFEEFVDDMIYCYRIFNFYVMFFCIFMSLFNSNFFLEINVSCFFDCVNYMDFFLFRFKVDLFFVVLDCSCFKYFLGDMSDKVFS